MNKKLLSLVMSGAMLASACSAGVSAVETKGIKGFAVNAVKFVKNHKPAVGGTVIGTTVVAGAIAWLYYHNRDITLTYSDDESFFNKLKSALKAFRNSLRIIGITQANLDGVKKVINGAVSEVNVDVKFNEGVEGFNVNTVEDTGVIVITKEVTDNGEVKLDDESEKDSNAEEEAGTSDGSYVVSDNSDSDSDEDEDEDEIVSELTDNDLKAEKTAYIVSNYNDIDDVEKALKGLAKDIDV